MSRISTKTYIVQIADTETTRDIDVYINLPDFHECKLYITSNITADGATNDNEFLRVTSDIDQMNDLGAVYYSSGGVSQSETAHYRFNYIKKVSGTYRFNMLAHNGTALTATADSCVVLKFVCALYD